MSRVQTYWCEPQGLFRHTLIVLSADRDRKCVAGSGLCSARVAILDRVPDERSEMPPESDPRWPSTCDRCGIDIGSPSTRAMSFHEYYAGAPDGQAHTKGDLPPGALIDDGPRGSHHGPDGIALRVVLPGGLEWCPDGPASNDLSGRPWTRTGDPRRPQTLTIRPSIRAGGYHGFLTNGVLEACGDSDL